MDETARNIDSMGQESVRFAKLHNFLVYVLGNDS